MVRRMLAFAAAFLIVGSPLAAELCDSVCVEHAAHARHTTLHHDEDGAAMPASHHHHVDVQHEGTHSRAAASTIPNPCRHVDAATTESRELIRASLAVL